MPGDNDKVHPIETGGAKFNASDHPDRAEAAASTVEDQTKALAACIADAIKDAFLPLAQAQPDVGAGERQHPFQTDIREALAPLQRAAVGPLVARLDQAIATEISLRSDLARYEYRATVAEKEARRAEERFHQREDNRAHEVNLLRQVIADLEGQVEQLGAENAHLGHLVNEMRDQEVELKGAVSSFAASRWVKVGTRLGLSQLNRHLEQRVPRDNT